MVMFEKPDWKCVFTYVQSFYRRFRNGRDPPVPTKKLTLTPPPKATPASKSIEVSKNNPKQSEDDTTDEPYYFPAPEISEEKKSSLMQKYLFWIQKLTKMYHFDDIEKYYELFVIFSQFCFISGPNEPKCNLQREVHEMKANKSLFAVFFVSPANNTFFVYFGYFSFCFWFEYMFQIQMCILDTLYRIHVCIEWILINRR